MYNASVMFCWNFLWCFTQSFSCTYSNCVGIKQWRVYKEVPLDVVQLTLLCFWLKWLDTTSSFFFFIRCDLSRLVFALTICWNPSWFFFILFVQIFSLGQWTLSLFSIIVRKIWSDSYFVLWRNCTYYFISLWKECIVPILVWMFHIYYALAFSCTYSYSTWPCLYLGFVWRIDKCCLGTLLWFHIFTFQMVPHNWLWWEK